MGNNSVGVVNEAEEVGRVTFVTDVSSCTCYDKDEMHDLIVGACDVTTGGTGSSCAGVCLMTISGGSFESSEVDLRSTTKTDRSSKARTRLGSKERTGQGTKVRIFLPLGV